MGDLRRDVRARSPGLGRGLARSDCRTGVGEVRRCLGVGPGRGWCAAIAERGGGGGEGAWACLP